VSGSPREDLPRFVEPMLATADTAPDGDGWALEVKFDGMRAQVRHDGSNLCVRSRPGRDCTDKFPQLESMRDALDRRQVILDGELVCFGADGRPDFERLRGRLRASPGRAAHKATAAPATFMVFDLLHLDGRSTRSLPYSRRRDLLDSLALDGRSWRMPPHWVGDRDAVVAATRDQGLEGVVAKRIDSPYTAGRRSSCWIKQKHRRLEQMVITGWVPSQPGQLESYLLARRTADGTLERAGSVSFGLPSAARETLRARLADHGLPPRRPNQRIRWVEPRLVATVDFHGPVRGPVRDAVLRSVDI
jgi:bifunctional non-homologous end joining protein LigD